MPPLARLALAALALFWAGCSTPRPPPTPTNLNPPPVQSTSTTKPTDKYVLFPGDVVQTHIYQEDDLNTSATIDADGTAVFPLIGSVRIEGKTLEEAAQIISAACNKDYLVNPNVTLTLVKPGKRTFTILGEVRSPNVFELPMDHKLSILEAIGMAGGYTTIADPNRIKVTRGLGPKKQVFTVNGNAAAGPGQRKPFYLEPGDVVTVGQSIF